MESPLEGESHTQVFTLPTGNREEYHDRSFFLCFECIRKIVDFIDEADETETRVEALGLEMVADALAEHAAKMKVQARSLDDLASGGDGEP
jgi:hypothetical protein